MKTLKKSHKKLIKKTCSIDYKKVNIYRIEGGNNKCTGNTTCACNHACPC